VVAVLPPALRLSTDIGFRAPLKSFIKIYFIGVNVSRTETVCNNVIAPLGILSALDHKRTVVSAMDKLLTSTGESNTSEMPTAEALTWLETVLPRIMRRLMDADNLDMPLLQLPLAQMRLAYALYVDAADSDTAVGGETMGKLSERLGVRQNALTQAADRLVKHGLAERLSDPSDRRIVRLRLTETGSAWVRDRRERRHEHLGALWAELNEPERQEFLHAVHVLQAVAERLNSRSQRDLEGNSLADSPSHHKEASRRDLPTIEETLARFTVGAANGAAAALRSANKGDAKS